MNNYDTAKLIIKITQSLVIVMSTLGAAVVLSLYILGNVKAGETSGFQNVLTLVSGLIQSVGVLLVGAIVWALLYGVRAVFEIAENTRK